MSEELLPCPWCGERLRHVESWARAFDPPRLYHEYHHDNRDCPLGRKLFSFTEDLASRVAFITAWNRRLAMLDLEIPPITDEAVAAFKACKPTEEELKRPIFFPHKQLRDLQRQGRSVECNDSGYAAAFYELAEIMGLTARPESPNEVWRREMRPRLLASFAQRQGQREGGE